MEIWSKCDICGRDIPVGELCYGLKKGNCICKDCCTGFENCTFTLAPAPTLTPPNESLTLEQLREMDGEPVWIEDVKHWALIDIEKGGQWDGVPFAVWAENGAKFTYNIMNRNLHCYRRPPEGEEDA